MTDHYGKLAGVFVDGEQVGILRRWHLILENKITASVGGLVRKRVTGWTATAATGKIAVEAVEYEFRFAARTNYYQVTGKIINKGEILEMRGSPPVKAIFP